MKRKIALLLPAICLAALSMSALADSLTFVSTRGAAKSAVTAGLSQSFLNQFVLYLATNDQTGWTDGKAQNFIGTAQTPRPTSLILLGTCLFGFAGAVCRKLQA